MHLIIYISDYTGADKEVGRDLIKIHRSSMKNNPDLGVTGVLFYHNRNFLQVLEGEQKQLEKLMATLEQDSHHTNLTRLVDTEIPRRGFPDWQMDVFNLDSDAVLNRRDLAVYKELFSTQCDMDAPVFINMLKSLYENVDLYKIALE